MSKLSEDSVNEVIAVMGGKTIVEKGLKWADGYMEIFNKLNNDSKAGSSLGHDTTKEVAALILVQLMERYA